MITVAGITGITSPASSPAEPPTVLITAREKFGKSFLATTLLDWPTPGKMPLVLAFDRTGPDSCQQYLQQNGRDLAVIKVEDYPIVGNVWDKTRACIGNLEQSFNANGAKQDFPFSSIMVDCASTACSLFYEGSRSGNPGAKDPRHYYGDTLNQATEMYWRLSRLHVPVIWLSWLKEPYLKTEGSGQAKTSKLILGGPDIVGNFRNFIAGKATQILILNKYKIGTGQPGADPDGFAREFRVRPWENVNGGGRFQWKLPEPCPAHLGYVLSLLMAPPQAKAA